MLLDKASIDREAARLTQENADLRQLLQNFLNGISVNDAGTCWGAEGALSPREAGGQAVHCFERPAGQSAIRVVGGVCMVLRTARQTNGSAGWETRCCPADTLAERAPSRVAPAQ